MFDFRNLDMWKLAHDITLDVYSVTQKFPKEEQFGITNQMRRAACSIGANIAEGAGRRTNADFKQFLHTSSGSLKELDNFIILTRDLKYLSDADYKELTEKTDHLGRMLTNFIKTLE